MTEPASTTSTETIQGNDLTVGVDLAEGVDKTTVTTIPKEKFKNFISKIVMNYPATMIVM